jgi:uncharacterized phage protein gp47/JayE
MAGLTAEGFEAKSLQAILDEIVALERALISQTLNTSTDSVVGQLNGIFAAKLRELWELSDALYQGFFTDSATGRMLTLRAAITGTTRRAATASRVTATVNVDPGTYAIGALVASVDGSPASRFVNLEAVTNGGAVADDYDVTFECEETGPVIANAGTLTVIAQAVSGWNSVTNADDAVLGEVEETDAELRIRREDELRAAGSTNVDAIRADLLRNVDGVSRVTILENDTGTTDVNGVPGHSIEAIVYGPASPTADDDQAVAEQVFETKAAGIGTYGSTTKTVVDDQGTSHSVKFTRPTSLRAYAWVTIVVDPDTYAGDAAVKAAISAVADDFGPGNLLRWTRAIGAPYTVAGVLAVTAYGQNTTGTPSGSQTDITPTIRQIVSLATADVTVTVT